MQTITTLENLDKKIRENRYKNLGENIVKYQNFKTTEVIRLIDNAGFKQETLRSYINSGINYINTGKKFKQYGNFYKYIDEAIARCVQPLTPKQDQIRQPHFNRYTKKEKVVPIDAKVPVVDVLNKIICNSVNTESSMCVHPVEESPKQYAVKMGKNLRLVDSIQEGKSFIEGLSFMGKTDTKLVEVIFKEIDEI